MPKDLKVGDFGGIGMGGRNSGGITGKGGKNVNPVYNESFSKRGSELPKSQNKAINAQSKAADSYKTKDLSKVESAQKGARTRKENENARLQGAYDSGKAKGAAAGVAIGAAAAAAAYQEGKKQGKKSSKKKNK